MWKEFGNIFLAQVIVSFGKNNEMNVNKFQLTYRELIYINKHHWSFY